MKCQPLVYNISNPIDLTPGSSILVDTNVWLWLCFERSTNDLTSQRKSEIDKYLSFIKQCMTTGIKLRYSPTTLVELSSVVEKLEFEIYKSSLNKSIGQKTFRHEYPGERTRIRTLVSSVISQVQQLGIDIPFNFDNEFSNEIVIDYRNSCLDGYDSALVNIMRTGRVDMVLTDDSDFSTVRGVKLLTANAHVIQDAARVKKLMN